MIKVEKLTREELEELGRRVGEAFVSENEGIVTTAPQEDMVKAFAIMTEYYYRAGVLYATGADREGLIAYWHKKDGMKFSAAARMVWRMLKELRFKSLLAVARGGEDLYSKVYRKERDYIVVSMVVVFPEYQGKGFMRALPEAPFAEAKSAGIPCVLDTDTELKVKKYTACGMKKTAEKLLKSGQHLYTMEYR